MVHVRQQHIHPSLACPMAVQGWLVSSVGKERGVVRLVVFKRERQPAFFPPGADCVVPKDLETFAMAIVHGVCLIRSRSWQIVVIQSLDLPAVTAPHDAGSSSGNDDVRIAFVCRCPLSSGVLSRQSSSAFAKLADSEDVGNLSYRQLLYLTISKLDLLGPFS